MNDSPLVDPAQLARNLRAGDAAAFGPWFESQRDAVWKLCFGFLADRHGAEDLAQDAMLHLHDHLSAWNPDKPYRAWRNTVVLNLCRDRLRRGAARRRAEDQLADRGLPNRLPRPDDAAHAREVREALAGALASLPAREREVFVLVDLERVPTSEAAVALGIDPSSVRSMLSFARRRLREIVGRRAPGLVPEAPAERSEGGGR